MPSVLQLIYLGNGEILRYEPDEDDLLATERKVEAIWARDPAGPGDRRLAAEPVPPVRLVLLHEFCPTKGGTIPPLPERPVVVADVSTDESQD